MEVYDYIKRLRQGIEQVENYGYTESVEIREEIRPQKQVVINAIIVFIDGSILYIREYTETEYKLKRISYAYQYQNKDGELIFRYDNAPHKPILGFKEHKHNKDGSITESDLPDIFDIID
ncbi:MAG: hypothetical protein HC887_12950 [Desulfobacteraceae bacterium]|nr:hypothetical protein [Desulfobacteraceae bacterium]